MSKSRDRFSLNVLRYAAEDTSRLAMLVNATRLCGLDETLRCILDRPALQTKLKPRPDTYRAPVSGLAYQFTIFDHTASAICPLSSARQPSRQSTGNRQRELLRFKWLRDERQYSHWYAASSDRFWKPSIYNLVQTP